MNTNNWALFYSAIEGFNKHYTPEYIYKIHLTKVAVQNPLANGRYVVYKFKNFD